MSPDFESLHFRQAFSRFATGVTVSKLDAHLVEDGLQIADGASLHQTAGIFQRYYRLDPLWDRALAWSQEHGPADGHVS